MGALSPILRSVVGAIAFWCPGCARAHAVPIKAGAASGPRWQWDGSFDRPTPKPSLLVTYNGIDAGIDGAPPAICHSFVRAGHIEFLADCTHDLAGQTVPIPLWPKGAERWANSC